MKFYSFAVVLLCPLLLSSVQFDDPFSPNYVLGPSESKGLKLHFLEKKYIIPSEAKGRREWTDYQAFLENTGDTRITVLGGATTIREIYLGEFPRFVIRKRLKTINQTTGYMFENQYGELNGRIVKEPLSLHRPIELDPGEIGLLFSISISAEEVANLIDRSNADKESRSELHYTIGKEFEDLYGVWSGALRVYAKSDFNSEKSEPGGAINSEAAASPRRSIKNEN